MTSLLAITVFVFAMSGEIKYPAICKETYLSEEKVQNTLLEAIVTPAGAVGTHNTMDFMIAHGIEQKAKHTHVK